MSPDGCAALVLSAVCYHLTSLLHICHLNTCVDRCPFFFVLWKSNFRGQEGPWPLLKGPSCGFLKSCINTPRSFSVSLSPLGHLSWLPLMQKSSWIRNDVVLKMMWFICSSQVVDYVALEIKVKGGREPFLDLALWLSKNEFGFKDVAFLRATCSWNYHARIWDVFVV